jgi:hypothetical protein
MVGILFLTRLDVNPIQISWQNEKSPLYPTFGTGFQVKGGDFTNGNN